MSEYLVTWGIRLDAQSPEAAARKALAIHRDPESAAAASEVNPQVGAATTVDLDSIDAHEAAK